MSLCQNGQSGVKDLKKGRVGMKKWCGSGYHNQGYFAFGLTTKEFACIVYYRRL